MTHLWCILVPFEVHFTVSRSPCFQCSKTKSRLHTKISTSRIKPWSCYSAAAERVLTHNTYPIPTATSRNHGTVTRSRCGDGVSVVMTVPHRVELI